LTDIDAVALHGDALVLIDAKAYRLTAAHGQGEYAPIESLRKNVEAASISWHSKVAAIRSNPELLPVEIPSSVEIHGLVVTPFVPYVRPGPATQRVLGLYHVSSVNELMLATIDRPMVANAGTT
jgi:hypothetical protein